MIKRWWMDKMNEENCFQFSKRQINIQRKNLVLICRLTVKSLIDKASITNIDDDSEELINFCAAVEQILTYRQKAQRTWYGLEEVRPFWDFIQTACRYLPNNCIRSIATLENVKSLVGKGRAWIRCVLMEKRLSEYLSYAVQQTKIVRRFYQDGSVMLSEDIDLLCNVLLGLNTIDFSFCLKGQHEEFQSPLFIDYTPYLQFQQSEESVNKDEEELAELSVDDTIVLSAPVRDDTSLEVRYKELEKNNKTIKEQKGYLEELLRKRDHQLQELQRKHQNLMSVFRKFDDDSKRDRLQMENVVIELQQQLASVTSKYEIVNAKHESLVSKLTTGFIDLEEVNPDNASWVSTERSDQQELSRTASPNIPESAARLVIPGTKTQKSDMQPESASMLAMAGSFSSQRSTEDTSSYYNNQAKSEGNMTASDAEEAIVINFPETDSKVTEKEGHSIVQVISESKAKGDNLDTESKLKGDNLNNDDKNNSSGSSNEKDQNKLQEKTIEPEQDTSISEPGTSSPDIVHLSEEDHSFGSEHSEGNSTSSPEVVLSPEGESANGSNKDGSSSPEELLPGKDYSGSDSSGLEDQYDMVKDTFYHSSGAADQKSADKAATG